MSAAIRGNFELVGPAHAPVVAVLGGISASRHVASTPSNPEPGWWEEFAGPDKAIDTNRFRILSIDYRSTRRSDRPLTTYDQALALTSALDEAGIDTLRAIVGASYGGMVALTFAAIAPQRVERLVIIGAAHESAPIATALRILQRRIVELGLSTGCGYEGLVIARGLAMTTYSSAEDFSNRFESSSRDDIADFLSKAGKRFADRCAPERFLALSESLDRHSVKPEDILVPTTLIAVEEDALVPISQVRELAARIAAPCELFELQSQYGHDTFLHAPALIAPFVARSLELHAVYAHD
ncbi:MAG: homoserine O-succinyltransferase [Gemmatimonadaceae bacterium]